jgi:hypothetical protein
MLLCAVAVGNVYPISRSDYRKPHDREYYHTTAKDKAGGSSFYDAAHSNFYDFANKSGMALKPGYDAHWFTVHCPGRSAGSSIGSECYLGASFPPQYDEVVCKEEKQVLPLAFLRFTECTDKVKRPVR